MTKDEVFRYLHNLGEKKVRLTGNPHREQFIEWAKEYIDTVCPDYFIISFNEDYIKMSKHIWLMPRSKPFDGGRLQKIP